ncbi:MAG: IclR family transcriptional regulator [Armatimonadota bacterium]|nr:IclR family transcriptional regulator [Armatimonadota bacterium]MDR5704298.1 IclR family transcriptional regulator [Armatimonadota bacterium]MDR7434831.1 IclR family transcriptional regulator [Armatimonadota bacterium]
MPLGYARGKTYHVRSVLKALELLQAFTPDEPEFGVTDLATRLGMHKSTVFRLLMTLEAEKFVQRDHTTGKYRLGIKLFELGSLVQNLLELRKVARPYLEELQERCGETIHLAVLDEGQVLYVDKLESPKPIQMYSRVGRRAPAHCTGLGKVLLAYLPPEEVDAIIARNGLKRYTDKTITDPRKLHDHLALVRQRGYATDIGEHEELIRCASAPIWDHTGKVVAAVSITTIGVRFDPRRMDELVHLVRETTAQISYDLGYRQGMSDASLRR